MPMSDEHKAALAEGRRQSRAIKAYLEALAERKPGRPVTRKGLRERIDVLSVKIETEPDPLRVVEFRQQRLDAEKQLDDLGDVVDLASLEEGFVEHASTYSARKGIDYRVWRDMGVPANVLRNAGIARTRRS